MISEGRMKGKACCGRKSLNMLNNLIISAKYVDIKEQLKTEKDGEPQIEEDCHKPTHTADY